MKEKIKAILEYFEQEQQNCYEQSKLNGEDVSDHMYLKIKEVRDWLDSPSCPLVDEDEL